MSPYVPATEHRQITERINVLESSNAIMQERFDRALAMLKREDQGWAAVEGVAWADDGGFSLEDLKAAARLFRESVVGAPWLGRGFRLRASYVLQGGMHYGNLPEPAKGARNVQKLIDDPENQANFFSGAARREREGCLYHDGISIWIGDDRSKKLEAIPIHQITDQITDPNGLGQIWAYKREWTERNLKTGKSEERKLWYFTDRFWSKRVDAIGVVDGKDEPVSKTHRVFDQHANRMRGNPYGAPDMFAAYLWNQIARDLFMNGVTIAEALTTFAFKATVSNKAGADNVGMKLATADGAGSTAITGLANDLVPMSSAGKSYDFESLRAVTAIIATALDVSNIHLTADPGAAGSSYGSAQTLDLPTRLAMEARRAEHIELDVRVLAWMGAKDAVAYFDSLDDPTEVFREVQALLLLWSSGLYNPEPLEKRLSELMQIIGNTVPENVLLPNNSDSWERADIDPKEDPNAAASAGPDGANGVGKPNATPSGQGQSSPVGKGANANDIRTERFAEMLALLDRFAESEARIAAARAA